LLKSSSDQLALTQGAKINWRALTKDIGGKFLAERKSLFVFAPYLVVISVLANSNSNPSLTQDVSSELFRFGGLVVANIAALAICWGYVEIVNRTVFKNKDQNPIKVPWVLLFSASLGFLKGYTTVLFSWLVGVEPDLTATITNRSLSTAVIGLWTVPLVAVLAATLNRFQKERQILLSESLEKSFTPNTYLTGSGEASEKLSRYLSRAKAEVSSLRTIAESKTSNHMISLRLRELVENQLRPISHRIWQESVKTTGELSLPQLAKLALKNNPFPIGLISIGLAFGIFPYHLSTASLGQALAQTLVTLAVACFILFIAKWGPRNSARQIWVTYFVANLAATLVSLIARQSVFDDPFQLGDVPIWISFYLMLLQLNLFCSIALQVAATRSEMRRRLIESLGKKSIDTEVTAAISRLDNRDLAQHIHANIQNKLLSFALKFDQENLSSQEVLSLLDELEFLFSSGVNKAQATSTANLDVQLAQLTQLWAGYLNIEVTNQLAGTDLSNETTGSVVQVVSEAVSNAVRHGLAKNIRISVEPGDPAVSYLVVTAKDDGLGPRSGKSGLGTELFRAAAGVQWSLVSGESGGSVLEVRLSRQPRVT
jgi:signal transduction histidine kinase